MRRAGERTNQASAEEEEQEDEDPVRAEPGNEGDDRQRAQTGPGQIDEVKAADPVGVGGEDEGQGDAAAEERDEKDQAIEDQEQEVRRRIEQVEEVDAQEEGRLIGQGQGKGEQEEEAGQMTRGRRAALGHSAQGEVDAAQSVSEQGQGDDQERELPEIEDGEDPRQQDLDQHRRERHGEDREQQFPTAHSFLQRSCYYTVAGTERQSRPFVIPPGTS